MSKARRDARAAKKRCMRMGLRPQELSVFDFVIENQQAIGNLMAKGRPDIPMCRPWPVVSTASNQPEPKLTIETLNKVIEILKENQRPQFNGGFYHSISPDGYRVLFGGCRSGKTFRGKDGR